MGVKDLWDVLQPVCRDTPIEQLRGKTLAVDLSLWLHQGMKASKLKGKQGIKPHLRNLFARVCLLLRHQIRPLFVFDGPTPKLKQATVEQRQRQNAQRSAEGETSENRVVPTFAAQQCSELLDCLGLPHLTSTGEAEMTCAQLNEQGMVDGCITEDSDAFLFGAKTIYRNFNVAAGKANAIHCYEMSKIQESAVNLTREKMVIFALLTGCDYGRGVKDVGKEKALKLLKNWPSDGDVLQRIYDWRKPNPRLRRLEIHKKERCPAHCRKCYHIGSVAGHVADGCQMCRSGNDCCEKTSPAWRPCYCIWHQNHEEYLANAAEISIRQKACADPGFPNKEIIEAFLKPDPGFTQDSLKLTWSRPKYEDIKAFLHQYLYWDDEKIARRMIPLYTSLDLCETANCRKNGKENIIRSQPLKILKSRMKEKKKIYEVVWKYIEGVSDLGVPESQLCTEELAVYLKEAFPQLVNEFELEMSKAKKRKAESAKAPRVKQLKMDNVFKKRKKRVGIIVSKTEETHPAPVTEQDSVVLPAASEMEEREMISAGSEPVTGV